VAEGRWSSSVSTLSVSPGTNYQSLKGFQRQLQRRAGEAIARVPRYANDFRARRKAALKSRDELLGETPHEMRVCIEGNIIGYGCTFSQVKTIGSSWREPSEATVRKSRVYRYNG